MHQTKITLMQHKNVVHTNFAIYLSTLEIYYLKNYKFKRNITLDTSASAFLKKRYSSLVLLYY